MFLEVALTKPTKESGTQPVLILRLLSFYIFLLFFNNSTVAADDDDAFLFSFLFLSLVASMSIFPVNRSVNRENNMGSSGVNVRNIYV